MTKSEAYSQEVKNQIEKFYNTVTDSFEKHYNLVAYKLVDFNDTMILYVKLIINHIPRYHYYINRTYDFSKYSVECLYDELLNDFINDLHKFEEKMEKKGKQLNLN